jgi:hypothetical protein
MCVVKNVLCDSVCSITLHVRMLTKTTTMCAIRMNTAQTLLQLKRGEFDNVDDFADVIRHKLSSVKQDSRVSNDTDLLSIANKVCTAHYRK